jgi:hypothetical protein
MMLYSRSCKKAAGASIDLRFSTGKADPVNHELGSKRLITLSALDYRYQDIHNLHQPRQKLFLFLFL